MKYILNYYLDSKVLINLLVVISYTRSFPSDPAVENVVASGATAAANDWQLSSMVAKHCPVLTCHLQTSPAASV